MDKPQADKLETDIARMFADEANDDWDELNDYAKMYLLGKASEVIALVLEVDRAP